MTSAVPTSPAPPRGGRDLKSAVLVGVGLLATALVGLFWLDWLLVLLVVALLVGAVSEIATAVRGIGLDVPRPPLWVAAAVLPLAAAVTLRSVARRLVPVTPAITPPEPDRGPSAPPSRE